MHILRKQQMHISHMAGDGPQPGPRRHRQRRLPPPAGPDQQIPGPRRLVGPNLGPNRLQFRLHKAQTRLRNRRLRRKTRVRRLHRPPSGDAG